MHRKLSLISSAALLTVASIAQAVPVYTGGNGGISFGVAPYGGAPNVGGPTFIANNFTGLNDVLTSPGLGSLGGYLTASPVIANNIASFGPVGLPLSAFQVGGGNGNGAFGAAGANALGSVMGYGVSDSGPGGGSASYIIDSEVATFTDAAGTLPGQTFGAYLAMAGAVPLVGNADVASLKVNLSSATAGSPFNVAGGMNLPNMVLAISRNGAGAGIGNFNIVAIGGAAGGNAGLILSNGANGTFRALSVDNFLPGAIPAGDVITVRATITAYADPASLDSFAVDPIADADLLALTGPLPSNLFISDDSVPEPASFGLLAIGLVGVTWIRRK